jgi:hypothetical protein
MTSQEFLEVWRYLAANPDIDDMRKLPVEMYDKIKIYTNGNILCYKFNVGMTYSCPGCPLKKGFSTTCSFYDWLNSKDNISRQTAAEKVIKLFLECKE